VLALWIVAWVVLGVVDLALGLANDAPGGVLLLAALTAVAFIVVGSLVIVAVHGSSLIVDRASERTLMVCVLAALLVGGGATILLPGVTVVVLIAVALFGVGFALFRALPAVISGRLRGQRPDEESVQRNARRDALFAAAAESYGESTRDLANGGGAKSG
jgi:Na+/melibiose symporter-like transporter